MYYKKNYSNDFQNIDSVFSQIRGRTYPKRRRFPYAKAKRGMGIAMQALKLAQHVKTLINVEHKFIDVEEAGFTVTNSGQVFLLTGIEQGDGESQRNGDKVKLTSNSMKMNLEINGTTAGIVRVLLVNDKVSKGVAPTFGELLQEQTIIGHYNPDNCPSRFKILSDKLVTLSSDNPQPVITLYDKLYHHITFTNTSATQADANTGHLYLFIITNLVDSQPAASFVNRASYVDN